MSKSLLLGVAVAAAFNCCCLHGVSGFLSTPSIPTRFSVKSKTSCCNRRRSRSSLPMEHLAKDGGGGGGAEGAIPAESLPMEAVLPTEDILRKEDILPTEGIVPTENVLPTEDILPTENVLPTEDILSAEAALPTELPSTAKARSIAERKASLMDVIMSTSMDEKESEGAAEKVNAIIGELETLQQGFKEGEVDGEWVLCFTRNSKGSPSLQKALPGDRGFQNFDVGAKKFFNIVKLWGGKVQVLADVAYDVRPEEPNKLMSTIVGAGVKLGPLRIPLPLTGRVGYLEFVYQDSDMRITRGNRGGLFLHLRPGSSFEVDAEGRRVA